MFHIGERVRAVREAKGLTQSYVADRLGVVQTTIGMYEKSADLKHSVIKKLANALEVEHRYLTGEDPTLEPLGVARVVRHESQRIFLASISGLADADREGYSRIKNHRAAPKTVQEWTEFREMLGDYFGGAPDRQPIPPQDDNSPPLAPTESGTAKKRMARVEPTALIERLRRVG
jgi:transcriptional regulator with XRE-family HTH domain